jgi:hypothetical protein
MKLTGPFVPYAFSDYELSNFDSELDLVTFQTDPGSGDLMHSHLFGAVFWFDASLDIMVICRS